MSYQTWTAVLEENFGETVSWRRHLHRHPEPSFEETKTRAYVLARLEEFGITDVRYPVGEGGIVATVTGGQAGPTIALRADFDALRIEEETQHDFRSEAPGIMHACGHDGHTAALLSVAKVVQQFKNELTGKVVFVFQHAEEVLPGGGKAMIEDGALDGVDAVYGIHLRAPMEFGKVTYCSEYAMAAADFFEIDIQGKGGHGASPHTTVDAVVVTAQIVNALQGVVSRQVDPVKPAVLTVSTFQAGGEAHNIIADKARLKGTVRTFQPEVREQIEADITQIATQIAAGYGATCEVRYTKGYPALYNHPKETALVKELMEEAFGVEAVESTPLRMGGEDFAYYLQAKPGSFFFVNAGNEEKGITYPHHHPKFDFDERALLTSGKAFLKIVDHYLG
ncbi:M20 metallopeptidase family protein [Isobaculum melis]|uniref:Amidohydrolase n=1 Tax=Isobaculum melis TaxID=142588 RepID=A0A1H9UGH8_9LACT|nr:amidohydrolase [Isobaculum melis]SES08277.1 amidohydrolase [Isobaculum melis]